MFGVICSGRLVQTEFQQIGETQFLTTILDADNVNHLVVFLTGTLPFPEGIGGQVYFSWPDPTSPPNWQPLGFITNQKPSAIFKLSNFKKLDELGDDNVSRFGQQAICHNAQVGISLEPLVNLVETPPPDGKSYINFAQKMLENFMNFALSFGQTQTQMLPNPSTVYVPLTTVQNWYANFERRLMQNPNFWKT